jgi:glycosyltransferase involved in cell wall biosynthesis
LSVIIPCHNYGRYLRQAIAGVLAQTYAPAEVLVIDDASTDDTPAVAAEFGSAVTYHRGKWGGPSGTRNHGIRHARGDYVALLDADDRWLPHKLAAQVEVLRRWPDASLVHGGWRLFQSDDDRTLMTFAPPEYADVHEVIGSCPIGCSTAVFPKALFEEVGGFDETLRGPEDWDLWIRLAGRAPVRSVPDVVAEYRAHASSLSRQHERQLRDSVRVLRKHRGLHGNCRHCTRAYKVAARRIKNMYYANACAEASHLWAQGHTLSALQMRGRALWNHPAAVSRVVPKVCAKLGIGGTTAATAD